MKADEYKIMCECVERGAAYGHNRAHKYEDTPTAETMIAQIVDAVMGEICEYFKFEESEEP